MGCISSKFDNDQLVHRCKARKRFMKQAVTFRLSFAAAHSSYLLALRNTGAALRQFAEGEARDGRSPPVSSLLVPLPEPPPPLPPLPTPSPSPALHNSSSFSSRLLLDDSSPSLENLPLPSSLRKDDDKWVPTSSLPVGSAPPSPPNPAWDFFDPFRPSVPPFHLQEQRKMRQLQDHEQIPKTKEPPNEDAIPDLEEDRENDGQQSSRRSTEREAAGESTAIVKSEQETEEVGQDQDIGLGKDIGLVVRLGVRKDLLEIVKELDDEFLKSSAGGADVSRTLETRKARFHTNFPKSKYRNQNSARVFSALSWNWSRSPLSAKNEIENYADETGATGSHALTLERLLAWEKKLYDEVKLEETLRCEHRKKCSLLRHQEARNEDANTIDKTRAQIKRLHSLILVSLQGIDSTIEAIESLRDDELHPQLVEFIEGLTHMWRTMHQCHAKQKQIVLQIKNLEALMTQEATSYFHHHATIQLEKELSNWYECFCKLVNSHRGYMASLNGWLRLSLVQIHTDKHKAEDRESPRKVTTPEVFHLCEEWQRALGCLPDKVASEALKSLVVVARALVRKQRDELRQKRKAEKLAKQLEKKAHSLQNIEKRFSEQLPQPTPPHARPSREEDNSEKEEEEAETVAKTPIVKDTLAEKRAATNALKKKVEGEKLKHSKSVQDTRVLTLNNLQTGLPGVFEAMTGFSAVSAQAFEELCSLTKNGKMTMDSMTE